MTSMIMVTKNTSKHCKIVAWRYRLSVNFYVSTGRAVVLRKKICDELRKDFVKIMIVSLLGAGSPFYFFASFLIACLHK